MEPEVLEAIIRRQPWGFKPVDASVIADQQAMADLFFSIKLIPKPISVAEAALAPSDDSSSHK